SPGNLAQSARTDSRTWARSSFVALSSAWAIGFKPHRRTRAAPFAPRVGTRPPEQGSGPAFSAATILPSSHVGRASADDWVCRALVRELTADPRRTRRSNVRVA